MLLNILILLPFITFISLSIIPKQKVLCLKKMSLLISLLILINTINIILKFNLFDFIFRLNYKLDFLLGIYYLIGVDGISIFFLILMSFLLPICLLVNWESIKFRNKDFIILLFILEFLIFNIFISLDVFFFFLFFEGVLIPMFLIIGIWGSRQRKLHAVYQFFLYTFMGSILMLISFLIIFLHVGSSSINIIYLIDFSYNRQLILWLCLFIAFGIKVPMFPFHIWLPEAHVEAPTSGSILLAGILLKLGTYGFLRFILPLFPYGLKFFTPFVLTICTLSIIYCSLSTIRQIDLKKIIAYSSIVHMNFAIIGLFSNSIEGLQGSFFFMISHGIISSALFLSIGILYDRYHTRLLYYYGGIVQVMPLFAIIFLIFSISNMGFPGTSGFIGEILILISIFALNNKIAIIISLSMVLSAIYSIWLYNRLIFGEIKNINISYNIYLIFYKKWLILFSDLSKREFHIYLPLIVLNLFLGVYPSIVLNISYIPIIDLLI